MFFEEATIHIYDAMNVEGADIQPTWLTIERKNRNTLSLTAAIWMPSIYRKQIKEPQPLYLCVIF